MARPAPAVGRAVALLDLLLAHPDQRFTLSELVRRTGVSLGSGHAVLAELEAVGYVRRHPISKTYALGPALAVAGAIALRQQPSLGAAIDELAPLARSLDSETLVTAATTDEIVFVAACRTGCAALAERAGRRAGAPRATARGGVHGLGDAGGGGRLAGAGAVARHRTSAGRARPGAHPRLLDRVGLRHPAGVRRDGVLAHGCGGCRPRARRPRRGARPAAHPPRRR